MLKYDYESKKDHVDVKESDEYFSSVEEVDNELDYMLSDGNDIASLNVFKDSKRRGNMWAYITLGAMGLVGGLIWMSQR